MSGSNGTHRSRLKILSGVCRGMGYGSARLSRSRLAIKWTVQASPAVSHGVRAVRGLIGTVDLFPGRVFAPLATHGDVERIENVRAPVNKHVRD